MHATLLREWTILKISANQQRPIHTALKVHACAPKIELEHLIHELQRFFYFLLTYVSFNKTETVTAYEFHHTFLMLTPQNQLM